MSKTNKPKVCVLLASYNGESHIEEQIHCILNQIDVDIDLYVSDDSSSDTTNIILKNIASKFNNIKVSILDKNIGAARNFYYLIANAPTKYDYFSLSDQDDIWFHDKLIHAIKVLEKTDSFGYSSDFFYTSKKKTIKYFKKSYPQKKYDFLFEAPGPGCSFLIKKELFFSLKKFILSNNLLNNFKWHDWLIYSFARKQGFKWIIDDNAKFIYRQHYSNLVGVHSGFKASYERFLKIAKGDWKKDIYLLHRILSYDLNNLRFYRLIIFNFLNCRRKFIDCIFLFLFIPLFIIQG